MRLREVEEILRGYGLEGPGLQSAVEAITADRQRFIDFLMRFELDLKKPDPKHAPISAFTIGSSYAVGGLVPLIPYMLTKDLGTALQLSVGMTAVALFIFGAVKGHFTGANRIKSAGANAAGGRHRGGRRLCASARIRVDWTPAFGAKRRKAAPRS